MNQNKTKTETNLTKENRFGKIKHWEHQSKAFLRDRI